MKSQIEFEDICAIMAMEEKTHLRDKDLIGSPSQDSAYHQEFEQAIPWKITLTGATRPSEKVVMNKSFWESSSSPLWELNSSPLYEEAAPLRESQNKFLQETKAADVEYMQTKIALGLGPKPLSGGWKIVEKNDDWLSIPERKKTKLTLLKVLSTYLGL